MRALIIDHEKIKALCDFADKNRIDGDKVKAMTEGTMPPIGDNPDYAIELPIGFRCVFSIEWQPNMKHWFRHLSVSVDALGAAPNPIAVQTLAEEFGIDLDKPHMIWPEDIELNEAAKPMVAVNVVQPLEEGHAE